MRFQQLFSTFAKKFLDFLLLDTEATNKPVFYLLVRNYNPLNNQIDIKNLIVKRQFFWVTNLGIIN